MSDTPVELKKPAVRLFEDRLKVAEYARTSYIVTAPPGSSPDDFIEPATYAHVLGKLRADDVLTVAAEDRTWRCEVLVLAVTGQVIHLAMLNKHDFEPAADKKHEGYEPEWAGPSSKWRVLRKSDRHVMVDKLGAKSDAVAWIEQNALKLAA